MQLNNFESAWKQVKVSNAMERIDSTEVLSIIERSEHNNGIKIQRALFTLATFLVLTISCQGG